MSAIAVLIFLINSWRGLSCYSIHSYFERTIEPASWCSTFIENETNCLIIIVKRISGMEDGSEFEENIHLIGDIKDRIVRTGTVRTASAHIITAVVGSGVLSLAWSVAQLGWIAGPFAIIFFAAVTLIQSSILADCYRSSNSEHGHVRNRSYLEAVKFNLGDTSMQICAVIQQLGLFGNAIAYTITSASSMSAIWKSICYHREHGPEPFSCSFGINYFMVLFGAFQVVLSLIPDIHDMEWLSMLATLMSFCYSTIAFALVFAKVLANGAIKGTIKGVPALSAYDKVIKVSLGLGDILYAYPFTSILLEIQDTLKSPPSETQTMKKATAISMSITTMFYLACGCFGYAAFGNETQGNLLSGSGFSEPYWLIDFANACVVIHIMGGYQMYSQPIFQFYGKWFASRFSQ